MNPLVLILLGTIVLILVIIAQAIPRFILSPCD